MLPSGFYVLKGFVGDQASELIHAVLDVARAAPWLDPVTPGGNAMSVRITSCGRVGWWSDRRGYRYLQRHPETGEIWPPVPTRIVAVVHDALAAVGYARPYSLDSCLINLYGAGAKMGLHRDKDEIDLTAPIVSVSLGDACEFLIGGPTRRGQVESVLLQSGDVIVLMDDARACYHGVRRIFTGSNDLLPGHRINITARQVWPLDMRSGHYGLCSGELGQDI